MDFIAYDELNVFDNLLKYEFIRRYQWSHEFNSIISRLHTDEFHSLWFELYYNVLNVSFFVETTYF